VRHRVLSKFNEGLVKVFCEEFARELAGPFGTEEDKYFAVGEGV